MRAMLLAVSAAVSVVTVACTPAPPGLTRERVLAEAVSSYNDTGEVYLVQDTVRPFPVVAYFTSRAGADSGAAREGTTYRVFGPHRGLAARDPWEVLSITVRVRTAAGERELNYDARTVDAVFLSTSAVRKFLLPYYRGLYGPDFANAVEVSVTLPRPPSPPCHRMSFPCTVDSLLVPDVR